MRVCIVGDVLILTLRKCNESYLANSELLYFAAGLLRSGRGAAIDLSMSPYNT